MMAQLPALPDTTGRLEYITGERQRQKWLLCLQLVLQTIALPVIELGLLWAEANANDERGPDGLARYRIEPTKKPAGSSPGATRVDHAVPHNQDNEEWILRTTPLGQEVGRRPGATRVDHADAVPHEEDSDAGAEPTAFSQQRRNDYNPVVDVLGRFFTRLSESTGRPAILDPNCQTARVEFLILKKILAGLAVPESLSTPRWNDPTDHPAAQNGLVSHAPDTTVGGLNSRLSYPHMDDVLTATVLAQLSQIILPGISPYASRATAKLATVSLNDLLADILQKLVYPTHPQTVRRRSRRHLPAFIPSRNLLPNILGPATQKTLVDMYAEIIEKVQWPGRRDHVTIDVDGDGEPGSPSASTQPTPHEERSRLFLQHAAEAIILVAQDRHETIRAARALVGRLNRALTDVSLELEMAGMTEMGMSNGTGVAEVVGEVVATLEVGIVVGSSCYIFAKCF